MPRRPPIRRLWPKVYPCNILIRPQRGRHDRSLQLLQKQHCCLKPLRHTKSSRTTSCSSDEWIFHCAGRLVQSERECLPIGREAKKQAIPRRSSGGKRFVEPALVCSTCWQI